MDVVLLGTYHRQERAAEQLAGAGGTNGRHPWGTGEEERRVSSEHEPDQRRRPSGIHLSTQPRARTTLQQEAARSRVQQTGPGIAASNALKGPFSEGEEPIPILFFFSRRQRHPEITAPAAGISHYPTTALLPGVSPVPARPLSLQVGTDLGELPQQQRPFRTWLGPSRAVPASTVRPPTRAHPSRSRTDRRWVGSVAEDKTVRRESS